MASRGGKNKARCGTPSAAAFPSTLQITRRATLANRPPAPKICVAVSASMGDIREERNDRQRTAASELIPLKSASQLNNLKTATFYVNEPYLEVS